MWSVLKNARGFTLIEILIVISLAVILVGFGSISYARYANRQNLIHASRLLENHFKLAKQKALSGNRPSGEAGELIGYKVQVDSASDGTYSTLVLLDQGGGSVNEVEVSSYVLSEDAKIHFEHYESDITFYTLAQGASCSGGTALYQISHDADTSYVCDVEVVCTTGEITISNCYELDVS